MLNDRQKKIIRNTLISLLGVITTFGFVCFIITKIPNLQEIDFIKNYANYIQWIGLFFPTFVGVLFKFILGQYQAKVINDNLENRGLSKEIKQVSTNTTPKPKKPNSKSYFEYNGYIFYVDNDCIYVKCPRKSEIEHYKDLKVALGEFIEKVRKDLPTQLI